MSVGVFDLFSIGIGPSSSHTVGPMRAARQFVTTLAETPADPAATPAGPGAHTGDSALSAAARIECDVFGSLAATGRGHGTFTAILLGLEGMDPATALPADIEPALARIAASGQVNLGGSHEIEFSDEAIVKRPLTVLDRHPNAMRLAVYDTNDVCITEETYYSVGGGFVVTADDDAAAPNDDPRPYPFGTGAALLEHCDRLGTGLSGVMMANELSWRPATDVRQGLLQIRDVMEQSVATSLTRTGNLPGGLNVRRRAPSWYARLQQEDPGETPTMWQEWVNLIALAVNEENASGGRIVTAPTNGAAGIVPAVLFYLTRCIPDHVRPTKQARDEATVKYLLAAGAIGVLYKEQASISGAEVGCQGEVGSASSMAAGGLAEVMGGTPQQVENAAEIAMEHLLGLTCDPIGGLVQIPCIERNAIAAATSINAARMALWGDGSHHVSLDDVIVTMRETGKDMSERYKETSTGGLAVNVVEC